MREAKIFACNLTDAPTNAPLVADQQSFWAPNEQPESVKKAAPDALFSGGMSKTDPTERLVRVSGHERPSRITEG